MKIEDTTHVSASATNHDVDAPNSTLESVDNLTTRYTSVNLPSGGRLGYPDSIEYRDIMLRDEKVIASATEHNFPQVLNSVLKSLLKDPSYFDRLSTFDRDFLLLWIWANNYSTVKTVEHVCTKCKKNNRIDIDLTEVPVSDLKDEYINPFPFTLQNGLEITLRLLTVGDETIVHDYRKKHPEVEEMYAYMARSVNFGRVMNMEEKLKTMEDNFSGKDMAKLRGFHAFFRYGLNEEHEYSCPACGEVHAIGIPFSIDFFLPSIQDDFGKTI